MASLKYLINSRYRIENEIGRGGMGVIYKALDLHLSRFVAIKILNPDFSSIKAYERFKYEIFSTTSLEHPNIVRVYDAGYYKNRIYYVMQYVEGHDLGEEIDAKERLELFDVIHILYQIAAALDYVHGKGFCHRDIKPGNILLDNHKNAYLTDFGVACSILIPDSVIGFAGTAEYASPEQCNGAKLTSRSDQYSLAATTYEMLVGSPPFYEEDGNPMSIAIKQINQEPKDPRTLCPSIPEYASKAILKALSKSPEQRFPSCNAFVSCLSGMSTDFFRQSSNMDYLPDKSILKSLKTLVLPHKNIKSIKKLHLSQAPSDSSADYDKQDSQESALAPKQEDNINKIKTKTQLIAYNDSADLLAFKERLKDLRKYNGESLYEPQEAESDGQKRTDSGNEISSVYDSHKNIEQESISQIKDSSQADSRNSSSLKKNEYSTVYNVANLYVESSVSNEERKISNSVDELNDSLDFELQNSDKGFDFNSNESKPSDFKALEVENNVAAFQKPVKRHNIDAALDDIENGELLERAEKSNSGANEDSENAGQSFQSETLENRFEESLIQSKKDISLSSETESRDDVFAQKNESSYAGPSQDAVKDLSEEYPNEDNDSNFARERIERENNVEVDDNGENSAIAERSDSRNNKNDSDIEEAIGESGTLRDREVKVDLEASKLPYVLSFLKSPGTLLKFIAAGFIAVIFIAIALAFYASTRTDYILEAEKNFAAARYEQAAKMYEEALKRDPDINSKDNIICNISSSYFKAGNIDKALEYCAVLEKEYPQAYGDRAVFISSVYAEKAKIAADYKTAEEFYKKSLRVFSDNLEVKKSLAELYKKNDEYDKALETYSRILDDTDNDEDRRLALHALTEISLNKKEYAKACEYFEQSISEGVEISYIDYAKALKESGKKKEALDILKKNSQLDELNSEIVDLSLELGEDVYREKGKLSPEVLSYINQARKLDKNKVNEQSDEILKICNKMYDEKKYKEAAKELSYALALNPESGKAAYKYILTLYKLNKKDEVIKYSPKAQELNKDRKDVLKSIEDMVAAINKEKAPAAPSYYNSAWRRYDGGYKRKSYGSPSKKYVPKRNTVKIPSIPSSYFDEINRGEKERKVQEIPSID